MGRRLTKTVNGVTTRYNDGDYVINETENDVLTATNIKGIKYIVRIDYQQGITGYYLYNRHGDVVNLVKDSGEYYDDEMHLYYLRARYYNPCTKDLKLTIGDVMNIFISESKKHILLKILFCFILIMIRYILLFVNSKYYNSVINMNFFTGLYLNSFILLFLIFFKIRYKKFIYVLISIISIIGIMLFFIVRPTYTYYQAQNIIQSHINTQSNTQIALDDYFGKVQYYEHSLLINDTYNFTYKFNNQQYIVIFNPKTGHYEINLLKN